MSSKSAFPLSLTRIINLRSICQRIEVTGKLLAPKSERQVGTKNLIYWSRNVQAETSMDTREETWTAIDKLLEAQCSKCESYKLQGGPVLGRVSEPHPLLWVLASEFLPGSYSEKLETVCCTSSRGTRNCFEIGPHFILLNEACPQENLFYQTLNNLGFNRT